MFVHSAQAPRSLSGAIDLDRTDLRRVDQIIGSLAVEQVLRNTIEDVRDAAPDASRRRWDVRVIVEALDPGHLLEDASEILGLLVDDLLVGEELTVAHTHALVEPDAAIPNSFLCGCGNRRQDGHEARHRNSDLWRHTGCDRQRKPFCSKAEPANAYDVRSEWQLM
jgi:hypothetical protein